MTDEEKIPNEEAFNFLVVASKQYLPFTRWGLNQLPYVLRDAVAKCMQEYADQQTTQLKAENLRLREAVESFMSKIPLDNGNWYLPGFTESLENLKKLL